MDNVGPLAIFAATVFGLIGLFIGIVWVLTLIPSDHDKYMKQCVEDGIKEYKCYAMLKNNDSGSTVVPMPIYTGR